MKDEGKDKKRARGDLMPIGTLLEGRLWIYIFEGNRILRRINAPVATPLSKLSLLPSVKLRLEVPLEGPYTRLLRRPSPEVEVLGKGDCISIFRGARIKGPLPLIGASVACYYRGQGGRGRLSAADFQDNQWSKEVLEQNQRKVKLGFLAVPVGHISLPNEGWVSRLAEQLTPWREELIDAWRKRLERNIFLNVLRIYAFEPMELDPSVCERLQPRIPPFRAVDLRPVLSDEVFSQKLDELVRKVKEGEERELKGFSRSDPKPRDNAFGKRELQPEYNLSEMAEETGIKRENLENWEGRLRRKKQVILYGPPGTGKTFLAERFARRMVGGTRGVSQLIQFHAGYAYEDFVQGLRPADDKERGGVFELAPGQFLTFCKRAVEAQGSPCALIIDEINRAPLARVFGELMYLLEYRERGIPLAAGGEPFRVPANLFLIGTMNTADRSIALVDQALRRRFAFIRVQPEMGVLKRFLVRGGYSESLLGVIEEINKQIGDPDNELGISFFMKEGENLRETLPLIWEGEIEPYLEEMFFDRPEKVESFRWGELVAEQLREWG
jgi:hypothetical protein